MSITRLRIFSFSTVVLFTILFFSLWNLQVNHYSYYKQLSDKNCIRLLPLPAARGSIYDRKGRVLAEDRPLFILTLIPQEFFAQKREVREWVLTRLSEITGVCKEEIRDRIERKRRITPPFVPLVILKGLNRKEISAVEESGLNLYGISIQVIPERYYPYGEISAHIIGYVGRGEREKEERRYGYQLPYRVGKAGIERSMDEYLRGEDGGEEVEVDHLAREVRRLGVKYPRKGGDIYLTIDIDLQKVCYQLLAKERLKGAIVVLQPFTGEILAMASYPSFNPNDFIEGATEKIRQVLTSPSSPLLNRAISGIYSPGSTFKPLVAIAGLEKKKIFANTYFYCAGRYRIGNRFFYCWKRDGHHWLDVRKALAYSCNVFFYKLGERLGVDTLRNFCLLFGLGEKTGVELPGEKKGLIPSREWKYFKKKEEWYKGETAHFAIGQGYLLTTPLQMARAISVIANKGYLFTPTIILKPKFRSLLLKKLKLSSKNIEIVRQGMQAVVEDPYGTAHSLMIRDMRVAAKTGTAQVKGKEANSWIVGFCPFEHPQIVFVILIEQGGVSTHRVGIARELIESWKRLVKTEKGNK